MMIAIISTLIGAAAGFVAGIRWGRDGVIAELETDVQMRREMLERLARLEHMRLVGYE
jgi:hypothetical protein